MIEPVSFMCKMCPNDCNRPLYRTNIANSISYFLKGIKNRDQKFIDAIENPSKSGLFDKEIHIEPTFKHNGYDVIKTGPFCNRYQNQAQLF